jgi:hypothetical protein
LEECWDCERVAFSRIRGSGKAAHIREGREWELRERVGWVWGGRESKVSARSAPQSESRHQNVRTNATHKESSREKSHVHRAKFNGRPKLPVWLGKDGAAAILGQAWLL